MAGVPGGDHAYSDPELAHPELAHDDWEYVSYHRGTAPFRSEIRLVGLRLALAQTDSDP